MAEIAARGNVIALPRPGARPQAVRRERAVGELPAIVARLTGRLEGVMQTAVPGLFLNRTTRIGSRPVHNVQTPALCLIAQGAKRLMVGGEVHEYDPLHYLVTSVDLPIVASVTEASAEHPYLSLRLDLDAEEIGALIRDDRLPPAPPPQAEPASGLYVAPLSATMLELVLRLLRLLESPADIAILAPLIKREILYRLLTSGQGAPLRQVALQDSHAQRVARAIGWLREHYAQPLRVAALARGVHMSISSLHHHFKAVTAMSPLQYQKQLRLQEARRLILLGDAEVAIAAGQVGYESASQFSREYGRLFGVSPLKDRRRWEEDPAVR